ncbi:MULTISPECIES: hypothetical protein [unclassified Psychrobacter]|uniref:hypothetical protein n=1 Tax=unclassified Psychrobacter TaxID=196806 RepID=UPI000A834ED2|nr:MULTISPECIES: hypothetical protein [unclassified Psychrobacter]
MSDTNNDVSDVKKAAEQVDSQQIDKNLNNTNQTNTAEDLSEKEQTPFIEENLRTDK